MEKTVNPTNNTGVKLTTQSLGIADAKAKDLAGYVLSQKDIVNATTKILIAVGIDINDIRTIKVGSDLKTKQLRIICEVRYRAAFPKAEKHDVPWYSIESYDTNDGGTKGAFNKIFYAALHNKVYHGKRKHLKIRVVRRRDPQNPSDTKKYVQFEFDPMILIAFVYNINFTDPLYRISAPAIRWKGSKEVNDMGGKERRKYRARMEEWTQDGLSNCAIYVTFNPNAVWEEHRRDENGNDIVNKRSGFAPGQVDDYYDSIDND